MVQNWLLLQKMAAMGRFLLSSRVSIRMKYIQYKLSNIRPN